MLSSDVLENQFGPTHVEVLIQDESDRVIATVADKSGQVLELSRVKFLPEGAKAYPEVHKAVLAGQSMGKAFRDAGVAFERKSTSVTRQQLPDAFTKRFGHAGQATVLEVEILVGPEKTLYARILETYSPAVTWPEQTKATDSLPAQVEHFARLLGKAVKA